MGEIADEMSRDKLKNLFVRSRELASVLGAVGSRINMTVSETVRHSGRLIEHSTIKELRGSVEEKVKRHVSLPKRGEAVLLLGRVGSGKTTFAIQFVAAGLRVGERAVIAVFEEHPDVYLERAKTFDVDLREAVRENNLRIMYLRPLDLSVDETLEAIRESVEQVGATRVVIDSISGFEMALAPTFRDDFRESLYRLIGAVTGLGVTVFSTVEVVETTEGPQLTGFQVSFLTDDILSQRFVEIEGELRKVLAVIKMRGSKHSQEFRAYEITSNGVLLGESLREYDGIITGIPRRRPRIQQPIRG